MKKIGFIGVGVMGRSMVKNLLKAGYEVAVYSRTKCKLTDFLAENDVLWCDSAAECAAGRDAVITIVGYPQDVEQVYFGENGILSSAQKGTYLIDMTTTDPRLSVRIHEEGAARGLHTLDAPVSGGDTGAKNGTLSIMVGGEQADFDACLPLFEAMGKQIVYEGPAGAGQHTKMANQIAIAGTIAGVSEALTYAERAGLDPEKLIASISKGAAGSWQMENLMPKMVREDYAPGFFLKHFIKDMKIAQAQNDKALPVLERVCAMYGDLEAEGMGDLGTQALIRHYREE
ncbi:MAG: NAD(P)-dependent oxidoreductase [Agathobaculum sp.]|jgi:3-hydroxyisobutyrate dehydrogenase-like beta-hydroxyacid dehydrogenase|uniref:NAD(P)-dependent oxidoreductase n=1 Tax=Agathobaculum sp. TaxID=2048138 RepID=UPI003D8CD92D